MQALMVLPPRLIGRTEASGSNEEGGGQRQNVADLETPSEGEMPSLHVPDLRSNAIPVAFC